MNIGPLNTRCRIEQSVVTSDPDYGSPSVTWTLLDVVWCGVQDVLQSKSESVKNGLATATDKTRVRMRYRTDIDSTMRLVIRRPDERVYQIVSGPVELGFKDGLEFVVEKFSTQAQ